MPGAPSEPQDRCPRCGASLSLVPGAHCARCLLALGLEAEPAPPAPARREPDAPPEAGAGPP
ncbi:MAG TPA: hypothetical protein VLL75_11815, partial [Vicinamibacteria bacterium]|nr:hypothetical protein [Vicinamibacteria bacterium]